MNEASKVNYQSLTAQQKSIWVHNQNNPRSSMYNVPFAFVFEGELDIKKLKEACQQLLNCHDILRIKIGLENDELIQNAQPNLAIEDLFSIKELDCDLESVKEMIKEDAKSSFDLDEGSYIKFILYNLGVDKNILLLSMSHLICDLWSVDLIIQELQDLYNGEGIRKEEASYLEYAQNEEKYLNSVVSLEHETRLCDQLIGRPDWLKLEFDYNREKEQRHVGDRVSFELDEELSRKIKKLSKELKVTPFMILLSAYNILLSKYSGQEDVVVGVPYANRKELKYESTIGFFSNTIPIASQIHAKMRYSDYLSDLRFLLLEMYDVQSIPIDRVVKKLSPKRSSSYHPIFQVMFTMQNTQKFSLNFKNLKTTWFDVNIGKSLVDLNLTLFPSSKTYNGFIEYDSSIFENETIVKYAKHYINILNIVTSSPEVEIQDILLLNNYEKKEMMNLSISCIEEYQVEDTIVSLFKKRMESHPDAAALVFGDQVMTYEQLDHYSNQIAHFIFNTKGQGKRIALFMNRSFEMIISILGVLKSGNCYIPIDTSYPQKRIDYILENSEVNTIITNTDLEVNRVGSEVYDFDSLFKKNLDSKHLTVSMTPKSEAYIIYTSGSTGNPKGVIVEHRNVVRLIEATKNIYDFSSKDIWTLFHSYAFDFSIWEIFGSLLTGGSLLIVPFSVTRSPEEFYKLVIDQQVSVLNQTPSAFRQFQNIAVNTEESLHLQIVIFGGEALDIPSLKKWTEKYGFNTPMLVNMYGITETTVHSTYKILKKKDFFNSQGSAIGKPLSDLSIFVVDSKGRLLPKGIVGEMYIGGQGVTRGYLNNLKLTDEKFSQNEFYASSYKIYKSGDLAKWNNEGELVYIGRADQQVKIRGFRIELEEIESVLNSTDDILESTISIKKDKISNDLLIIAYLIPSSQIISLQNILKEIKKKLPNYMIPNHFVKMDKMPLTANGKIDKRALPEISEEILLSVSASITPEDSTEEKLLIIWKEVLSKNNIGVTDNFFDLGGHSILAVKLMSLIKSEMGVNIPISALYSYSTIRELSGYVQNSSLDSLKEIVVRVKAGNKEETPLFFIHPGMGQIMCFNEVINNIKHIPIYAIRAAGLYGEQALYDDVREQAYRYLKEIQKIQPKGPYCLIGYCVGGAIANEIAYQLNLKNEKIQFLGIIDGEVPKNRGKIPEEFIVSFFVDQLLKGFETQVSEVEVYTQEELKQKKYNAKENIAYLTRIIKKLGIVDDSYSEQDMEYWYLTWKNLILAMNRYDAPDTQIPIHYYFAEDGEYSEDEWAAYSSVIPYHVTGDHYSMLKDKNAKKLANLIYTGINSLTF